MANQNNLIRPPVLNPEQNENVANRSMSEAQLATMISRIASEIVNSQGPMMVQAALNTNSDLRIVRDQTIDERYANDLSDMDKVPDVVKSLKEFSGKQGEYTSWKKSVERILKIYEPNKGTPKYYGIINVVRNKIVGNADAVLESYNTPLDWGAICKCLSLHYADKRDISILEYQMTSLIQGNMTTEEFYQAVYRNLSLILNKIGSMEVGDEASDLLTQTYRDKALDTFVRGLNGDMPRLLGMKEPIDLPQALHLCSKLENQKYRTQYAHSNNQYNYRGNAQFPPALPQRNNRQISQQQFYPQVAYLPRPQQQFAARSNIQGQNWERNPPPRPLASKPQPPPEPMDVDESIRSKRVNYMNRPQFNPFNNKRSPQSMSNQNFRPNKAQRNFHIEDIPLETTEDDANNHSEEYAPDEQQYYEYSDVHFLG